MTQTPPVPARPATIPPPPLWREVLTQLLASAALALGAVYLIWRWTQGLNPEAMWFSIPVALAETALFLGSALFFHDIWATPNRTAPPPPTGSADIGAGEGLLTIDILITTYNEAPDLLAQSLSAAQTVTAPPGCAVQVHLLDDGDRPTMAQLAAQFGATYHRRSGNQGYKAGNLRNALRATSGQILVICDADTRLYPDALHQTLGYFRDPQVAFVQTPHWFDDLPTDGADPFYSDPSLFFDVIQRRRDRNGAAFCCGAASLHRREALIEGALQHWGQQVRAAPARCSTARRALPITPFRFHVSEDLATSLVLHARGRWWSVYHPGVIARMVSPWGMSAFATQRMKYAWGTIDLALRQGQLWARGLPLRTRLHYLATFWSYLSAPCLALLLCAPALTLATGLPPVGAPLSELVVRLGPAIVCAELALLIGCWGYGPQRGARSNIATLGLSLTALKRVLRGQTLGFAPTPKSPVLGDRLRPVRFHLFVAFITLVGLMLAGLRAWISPDPIDMALTTGAAAWAVWTLWLISAPIGAVRWSPKPQAPCPISDRRIP